MSEPTVLIVDDEPELLRGLQNALRREPYRVLVATGAESALALVEQTGPQVVISDQDMPFTSGTELLRAIARRHPEIVRMMLTGRGDLGVAMRAINEGEVFRFFTKPIAKDVLGAAIREALAFAAARKLEAPLVARRAQAEIEALEEATPGITHVATSRTGAIVVAPTDDDVAALVAAAVERMPQPRRKP